MKNSRPLPLGSTWKLLRLTTSCQSGSEGAAAKDGAVPHGPPGLDHKDYIIYETCIRKRWVPRMCVPSADPKHHVNRGAETPRTRHAMRRARGRSSKAPRPPPLRRPQMCTPKHTTLKIQELAGPRCGASATFSTPTQSPDTHALRKTHITPLMAIHAIQAGA